MSNTNMVLGRWKPGEWPEYVTVSHEGMRECDLTEWGTSIVPKETIADRDALLALADEIDRKSDDGTVNPDPMKPIASSLDLFGYAW